MSKAHPYRDHLEEHYVLLPNQCCEWIRGKNTNGYAQVRTKAGPKGLVHRMAYEDTIGPVPAGMDLDHLCRNRACINPYHLEPVTRRENVRRGVGPTAENMERAHCRKGHPLSGDNLSIEKVGQGRTGRRCLTCLRIKVSKPEWREKMRRYQQALRASAKPHLVDADRNYAS